VLNSAGKSAAWLTSARSRTARLPYNIILASVEQLSSLHTRNIRRVIKRISELARLPTQKFSRRWRLKDQDFEMFEFCRILIIILIKHDFCYANFKKQARDIEHYISKQKIKTYIFTS